MSKLISKTNSSSQQSTAKLPEEKEKSWLGRTVVVIAVVTASIAAIYCLYELSCYLRDVAKDKFSKETDQQLEEKVLKKGLGPVVIKVKQIASINQRTVLRRLSESKEPEIRIFKHLDENFHFSTEHLKEMLMGAHIRLNDKGSTYHAWAALVGLKPRISSHPSDRQQFGLRGSLVKELLFSSISDKDKRIFTWFQLENNPVSFGSVFRHMIDYVNYKISEANQGPYGSSPLTDLNPLLIESRII